MYKIISKLLSYLITALMFIMPVAAAGESDFPSGYYDIVAVSILLIILLIIIGFLYYGTGEGKPLPVKKAGLIAKIKHLLTRSVPVEKEDEVKLEGHVYDGIVELDNKVPPWFSGLFYATIIFAVYYMLHYHVFGTGKLMHEEYEEEMRQAEILRAELVRTGALIDEKSVELLTDEASLVSGKAIYDANCVACHGAQGEGLVGPNLTDGYWVHGGGISNVFRITRDGVPAKGMIAWKTQLNPKQIQEVSSYVISLEGTNPPNPKAPEGEKWLEDNN